MILLMAVNAIFHEVASGAQEVNIVHFCFAAVSTHLVF
jgi:hypothetical protein